jgi:hypothetical protein
MGHGEGDQQGDPRAGDQGRADGGPEVDVLLHHHHAGHGQEHDDQPKQREDGQGRRRARAHHFGSSGRHRAALTAGRRIAPTLGAMASTVEKLLLAAPRGYCAGVDRAVQTVERALDAPRRPVYVRKEIVHNKHVVEKLRERGAVFVDELDDSIPEGSVTVFSAHGVSPAVHAEAERRGLDTIDATCPLVTKVHREAVKFAEDGYTIVLIGHSGHEEVEGTMGEAPDHIVLVETEDDVAASRSPIPSASPTSRRPRCRSTRPARSSPGCASASRRSPVRAPTTSVTRRPTARRPSSSWPRTATSCSSSARRTPRTRSASSRSRASTAPTRT